jgi:hypothetical protein
VLCVASVAWLAITMPAIHRIAHFAWKTGSLALSHRQRRRICRRCIEGRDPVLDLSVISRSNA